MITRAKISVVRALGLRRLLTFLSQMRRLFEGGAYSSKYGNAKQQNGHDVSGVINTPYVVL